MIWRIKGTVRLRIFLNMLLWCVFLTLTFVFLLAARRYINKVGEPPEFSALVRYGVVCLAMLLPFAFRLLKTNVKREIDRYIRTHPYVTMELLENDFSLADKCGIGTWIGEKYMFHFQSTFAFTGKQKLIVMQKDQIVWAYKRKEWKAVAVWDYSVCVALLDGTEYELVMSKRQQTQMMAHLEQLRYVVCGYQPDYAYQFRNDRGAFLEMRYYPYMDYFRNRL